MFLAACMMLCAMPPALVELPLNEGDFNAVADSSARKNDVQIFHPEYLKWVPGPHGQAIEFNNPDGNHERGMVQVKTPQGFDVTKGFSFTCTFKPGANFIKRRIYPLFRFADGGFKGNGVLIFCTWNMLWARLGVDDKYIDAITNVSDESILPNHWYHLAVTFDGKTVSTYLNGRLAASKEASVKQPQSYNHICIGSTGDGYGYGFEGIITNVKVFDRALTVEDITSLHMEE